MVIGLSPYEFLLEKVRNKEIDPEDVDINELIEDFRKEIERLSSVELFWQAGSFLQAMASLLKLKADKLLGVSPKEQKRKPKIKLEEVLKAIGQEQDSQEDILDSLWGYSVGLGRKVGSKDSKERLCVKPEVIPLHKAFDPEEYRKILKELGLLGDFERLKDFLLRLEDRMERLRFFIAWLG